MPRSFQYLFFLWILGYYFSIWTIYKFYNFVHSLRVVSISLSCFPGFEFRVLSSELCVSIPIRHCINIPFYYHENELIIIITTDIIIVNVCAWKWSRWAGILPISISAHFLWMSVFSRMHNIRTLACHCSNRFNRNFERDKYVFFCR